MMTVHDLFDKFGGATEMARFLDLTRSAASEMKRRQRVPVKYWPRLADECKRRGIKGVSYAALVRMNVK